MIWSPTDHLITLLAISALILELPLKVNRSITNITITVMCCCALCDIYEVWEKHSTETNELNFGLLWTSLVIWVNDKNIHLNVLPLSNTNPGSTLEMKIQSVSWAHMLGSCGDLMGDFSQMQALFLLCSFCFIVECTALICYNTLNWLLYYLGFFYVTYPVMKEPLIFIRYTAPK